MSNSSIGFIITPNVAVFRICNFCLAIPLPKYKRFIFKIGNILRMDRILVDPTNPFSIRYALSSEYNEHNIGNAPEVEAHPQVTAARGIE